MIFSNLLLGLLLTINSILPVYARNLPFNYSNNQFKEVSSILSRPYDTVERFQCQNGWERNGRSCYFYPNTRSMPNSANQTCIRHLNNSQLMKILFKLDFHCAAHFLEKYNLWGLIVEIDPKLRKEIKNFDVLSTNDLVSFTHNSTDSTKTRTGNYQDFKQVGKPNRVCDKLVWDTNRDDSYILLFTTYLESGKTVCSLSDVKPNESYGFMCQYVPDYCFANDKCGMFGRCINTLTGFKCLCYLSFFRPPYCRWISGTAIQMIIVVVVIIVLQSYIRRENLKKLGSRIKYVLTCCKKEKGATENGENNVSVTDDDPEERTHFSWWLFFTTILLLLLAISTIYRPSFLRFYHTDQLNMTEAANDFKQMDVECKRCSFLQGIIVICGVLVFAAVCLPLLIKQRRELGGLRSAVTEFLIPFKPFELTNRYETAAAFGVVVFELATILNNVLLNFTKFLGPGIITEAIQNIWNLFIVIIKYYPIFISLRQSNVIISFLAVAHYMVTLVFIIRDKISCWNFFPPLKEVSHIEDVKLYMMHGKWIVGLELFRNILYFILLAYVGAEIIARFLNVLKHIRSRGAEVFTIINSNKMSGNTKQKSCCSCLRSVLKFFYPWNDEFQFVTISLCTYIGALIFVCCLICALTLQALMGRSTYINFLTDVVDSTSYIKIRDFSLWWEIIVTGAFTMILFSIQLLTGMKNCKKNAKIPNQNTNKNGASTNSLTSESIKYLKHCISCMAGGVHIIFPLVLFILIIVVRIPTQFETVEPFLAFVLPPLLLCMFQASITALTDTSLSEQSNENSRTAPNTAMNTAYIIFITTVFLGNFRIGIATCVFRLLKKALKDIISGTQIDCSKLGQPREIPKYLCIEHQTDNGRINNTKHENAIEDTTSSRSTEAYESKQISPIAVSQPGNEIIPSTSPEIPLSPDVQLFQTQPLMQQEPPAVISTSSRQHEAVNGPSSMRNCRGKGDDDFNREQIELLLLERNTDR